MSSPIEGRLVQTALLIPAFNEEQTIAKVIVKAKKYVDRVIVCDDGSDDMTAEISRSLGAEVVRHERNLGYGAALSTLFMKARQLGVEVAVTLDGDDQHNPAYVRQIVEPIIANEADVVVGTRFRDRPRTSTSMLRKIGIGSINHVIKLGSGKAYSDSQSGMRAYRSKVLSELIPTEMGMGASTEILMRASSAGLRIKEVGVPISYAGSQSSQNPVFQWLDVVGATLKHISIRHPLKFYGIPAFLFLCLGVFFGIWTVNDYLVYHRLTSNIAIISLASTIIGLILGNTALLLSTISSIMRDDDHRRRRYD